MSNAYIKFLLMLQLYEKAGTYGTEKGWEDTNWYPPILFLCQNRQNDSRKDFLIFLTESKPIKIGIKISNRNTELWHKRSRNRLPDKKTLKVQ